MASRSKSDAPVAARDELEQRGAQPEDTLAQDARDQEKVQREELLSGAKAKAGAEQGKIEKDNIAGARVSAGHTGDGAQGGFMDQISRAYGDDALEGHFVNIDLKNKEVQEAYKNTQGLDGHTGSYGVYLEPQALDPDTGRPLTALVRLRDETNARVSVPYVALSAADPRGR